MHIMAHFPIFDLPVPALLSLHIMPVFLSLISLSLSCLCTPWLISFLLYVLPHYPVVEYHACLPVIDFIVSILSTHIMAHFLSLICPPQLSCQSYQACLPVIDLIVSVLSMHIMAHFLSSTYMPSPTILSLHIMPVFLSLISFSLSCLCISWLISLSLICSSLLSCHCISCLSSCHWLHCLHPVYAVRISWLISYLLHAHPCYPVVAYHASFPVIDCTVSVLSVHIMSSLLSSVPSIPPFLSSNNISTLLCWIYVAACHVCPFTPLSFQCLTCLISCLWFVSLLYPVNALPPPPTLFIEIHYRRRGPKRLYVRRGCINVTGEGLKEIYLVYKSASENFKVSRAFGIPQRYLYFINWLHLYTIPPVSLFISTKGRRVRYN